MLLRTAYLILFVFRFSLFTSFAQGLPLIRNYTAAEYGGHNRNYDIEISDDGTVFVANFEGLLYYDRARWRIIHTPNNRRVTVIYRDSKNTIWVGGYNNIARLEKQANGELFMHYLGEKDLFRGEVMEIFEEGASLQFVASDNNIYEVKNREGSSPPTISLKKHTNAKFHPGVVSEIVSLDALQAGAGNVILEDITQTVKLNGGLQVKVKKNNGLIIADNNGRDLYTITEDNGLCSNQVSYVAYDGHGVLWGTTENGIFSIELPSAYSYFLPKDGLTGRVHAITAFNGKIYVGDTNGLFVVDKRRYKHMADINNVCWELCPTRDGLLAATSSGIYRVEANGSVSRLTSHAATALMIDGDKIYAGEADGVYVYQSDKSSKFKAQSSKLNDLPLVTEIRKDGKGGLWFKTVYDETKGIQPKTEKEPLADLPGHLLKPVSSIDVKAQYRHGSQFWIGGNEILAVIDTGEKDIEHLSDCRRIRFRSIVMGNDSMLWGGFGDMPKKLQELDSNEGHLHFFYALDYAPLTGKTLYRYRLHNKNILSKKNQWSAWSEKQDVAFLNLPYGSFTLSVQAQLANGELSEVASVDFSIAYPLLMRWYMAVLYLLVFAYILYLLFRYRLKKLQRDKIKLEQIVEERTADLRKAQHELIRQEKMASVGKLTKGLIDRILNPMNYIINFSTMNSDLLNDLKGGIENNKEVINQDDYNDMEHIVGMLADNLDTVHQYGQNTTRTLKAMEEMLKDRTGGYVDMDLLPVLQQNEEMVLNYFAKEIEQYHIQTVFSLPDEAMMLHGNPDMLSKTIMNLLGNAVYAVVKKAQKQSKLTPSSTPLPPQITLTATISSDHYILKIRDNGIGIKEKNLEKIFDPFFTTKTTEEAAGIGLYLSREIIQNHAGDISVASVKDEFTEFTITLPKKNSHEADQDISD